MQRVDRKLRSLKIGIGRFSETCEVYNAEDVLDEDIWLDILDKLSSGDWASCFQACVDFRLWLGSRRPQFLFSSVLPFLDTYLTGQFQSRTDLANCRLVCRSWKEAVDNHMETSPFLGKIDKSHLENATERCFTNTYFSIQDLAGFHHLMHTKRPTPDHNPFLGRSVAFDEMQLMWADEAPVFWEGVTAFLRIYGVHLWYCQVNIHIPQHFHFLYEQVLLPLTTLMPNLKALTIRGDLKPVSDNFQMIAQVRARVLVQTRPLSRLPNLVRLTVDLNEMSMIITEALLRSSDPDKLEQLYCTPDFDCPRELSAVTQLQRVFLGGLQSEYIFAELGAVTWPLVRVSLDLHLRHESTFPNLLWWLAKFGNTLEKLSLFLFGYKKAVLDSTSRLRLPRLKELVFSTRDFIEVRNIDFVEELQRLEKLTVKTSFRPGEKQSAVLAYAGSEAVMEGSNIWKILPELAILHLKYPGVTFRYCKKGRDGAIFRDEIRVPSSSSSESSSSSWSSS